MYLYTLCFLLCEFFLSLILGVQISVFTKYTDSKECAILCPPWINIDV